MSIKPDSQSDLFGEIGNTIGDVERWAEQNELRTIVGVDEAGRGPLAGPVVASAVVLDLERASHNGWLDRVTDSKLLSETTRCELFEHIRLEAKLCALGQSEAWEIDELNILQASLLAMRRAVVTFLISPSVTAILTPNALVCRGRFRHHRQFLRAICSHSVGPALHPAITTHTKA